MKISNHYFGIKSESKMGSREKLDSSAQLKLMGEYKAMQNHELYRNGIYVMPSTDTCVWNCVIFVKSGHFKDGKFKLKLRIPEHYPRSDVRAYFQSKIYHPMVNFETGELDLQSFPKSQQNVIERLLLFTKSIFTDEKALQQTNSYNPEAGKKFQNELPLFIEYAKKSVESTEENILNDHLFKTEDCERHIYDIKDLTTNLAKCTGAIEDKVSVLIDNVLNSIPRTVSMTR